jgi:hypothetical protein
VAVLQQKYLQKNTAFRDVTPCILVETYQRLRGIFLLHFYSSTLKMKLSGSSETFVHTYQTTRCHIMMTKIIFNHRRKHLQTPKMCSLYSCRSASPTHIRSFVKQTQLVNGFLYKSQLKHEKILFHALSKQLSVFHIRFLLNVVLCPRTVNVFTQYVGTDVRSQVWQSLIPHVHIQETENLRRDYKIQ